MLGGGERGVVVRTRIAAEGVFAEVQKAIALRVNRNGRGCVRILHGRKIRGGEVIMAPAFIDGGEISIGAAGGTIRLAAQRPAWRRAIALPVGGGAADDEVRPPSLLGGNQEFS